MSRVYHLMSRQGCHLCQQVAAQLTQAGVAFSAVDIDRDDVLYERYHTLVPVLYCPECGGELLFPFSEAELSSWLAHSHGQ